MAAVASAGALAATFLAEAFGLVGTVYEEASDVDAADAKAIDAASTSRNATRSQTSSARRVLAARLPVAWALPNASLPRVLANYSVLDVVRYHRCLAAPANWTLPARGVYLPLGWVDEVTSKILF